MSPVVHAVVNARWQVLWVRNGRIIKHDYGDNFTEARRIYLLAKDAGRKMVTLRCKNVGFPPPEKYRPREVVVRRNRKKVRAMYVPMKKLNARGVWWCSYCLEFRRFRMKDHFVYEGIRVEEKRFACPMCEITVSDHNIRKWNPQAARIDMELRSSRTGKKKGRKRRRRRKEQV